MTRHDQEQTHEFFRAMHQQILETPLPHRSGRIRSGRRTVHGQLALWPLAGVSAALASILTVVALALGASSNPSPAYAVTINPNRGVTIYLREFRDIDKLNARLAALHTRIRAVPATPICVDPVHSVIGAYNGVPAHVAPGPARTLKALPLQHGIVVISETIENNTLPGRTLVIPVMQSGLQAGIAPTQGDVVVGPAPRCVSDSRTAPR
jgi:hypothetical protein